MDPAFDALDDAVPHARLLSNGRYSVLLTGAGAGVSSWDGLMLTAWGGDRTIDGDGVFVYLRDVDSGDVWSAAHQPVGRGAERYAARYTAGVVTITRGDGGIETAMDVCVAPAADVEVRRLRVSNRSDRARRIAVTAYAEIVLNDPVAHASHPGFSKLFVQTEAAGGVLLARRRPRSRTDRVPWMVATLRGDGPLEHETDRARFLGRGRSTALPAAVASSGGLSGTTGSVLDPVFALRRTLDLAPGASAEVTLLLGAADTREAAVALVGCDVAAAFVNAATAERALCEQHGLTVEQGEALQELAGAVAYGTPGVATAVDHDRVRAYWEAKGFPLEPPAAGAAVPLRRPADTAARFRPAAAGRTTGAIASSEVLRFDNGHGGFSADGREYVIRLDAGGGGRPPMPWVNVIANERFGCFVSESGAAYTWSRNSREHRLTPWWNDPIADPHGEALWVRDDEAGVFWSPVPGPVPPPAPVEVRHGFGVSRWRHASHDLAQEVALFVARHDPVKIVRVRLTNTSARVRTLQVFSYAQLVLGVFQADARSIETEIDSASATLFARNPRAGDFADGVTFAAATAPAGTGATSLTADRTAFLGRNGTTACPAAVAGATALDGGAGAGLDPCAAIQLPLTLAPGATVECAFLLGETTDRDAAAALVARYREPGAVERALAEVEAFWHETLTAVQVETPSPGLDVMVNGWLGYQNVSCRLWGRSAFYQSGGAFGFRDQLQDAAALVYARPDLTRAQIVLHAGHQFVEGDVLHWWHPPADRGMRTRFSDDLVWLPYVTAFYVRTTGDFGVLDEVAPFVTAPVLAPGEDEAFLQAQASGESADVYAHCCRALDRALTRGAHGLPLMGTGDWNDGMNRVGREGRGESVWLGFFISFVLREFLPLCERRGDDARAERYRDYRARLHEALEAAGWDGDWYRRAYYDDGTPLGTSSGDECRIDAIAQAWSVISGAAARDRAARAMDAVERELVDERAGIIRLLAPPFDKTPHDPGYIKGYVPGIRENGGQYTHGALWVVRALAELGRRDRAARLLEMLGPVHHARSKEAVATYQVEPYVVAADVYGVPPHVGRGGWTWYTGSAGWMYRVALESVLGITIEDGTTLRIAPKVPDTWPAFRVRLRRPNATRYDIEVLNPRGDAKGVASAEVDGKPAEVTDAGARVRLETDGAIHHVRIVLGGT